MRLKIISFIKRQDQPLKELEAEYLKRMNRWLPSELIEIRREEIREKSNDRKIHEAESRKLENVLKGNSAFVVLDSHGLEYTSEELAGWLQDRIGEGLRELVFVIGGPMGLSEKSSEKARWKISLSQLTFTHKLARLILLETLYRALAIAKGTPYHK